jgi:hypothetical protein
MAVSLNTFAHLAIICVFVGIFSWNLLDYREGLDENEGKAPPEKELSEKEKEELARKEESENKKAEKALEDSKKIIADMEDRL